MSSVEEKWHPVDSRKEVDRNIAFYNWDSYQKQNPLVANEILALGLDFSKLSANDINERVFALQKAALDSKCRISELKGRFIKAYSKIDEWMLLKVIERAHQDSEEEARQYKISTENTFAIISLIWIYKMIEDIEKEINAPSLSRDSVVEMTMKFDLESHDKYLWERKWHIYVKQFPQYSEFVSFKNEITGAIKRSAENTINYLNNIEELKSNADLYNISLTTELMRCKDNFENMDKFQNIVDECNKRDISYYVELQKALDEIECKYKK